MYGKTLDLFRYRLYIYICRIGRISSSIISRLCTIYNWNCYALKVKRLCKAESVQAEDRIPKAVCQTS